MICSEKKNGEVGKKRSLRAEISSNSLHDKAEVMEENKEGENDLKNQAQLSPN